MTQKREITLLGEGDFLNQHAADGHLNQRISPLITLTQ